MENKMQRKQEKLSLVTTQIEREVMKGGNE